MFGVWLLGVQKNGGGPVPGVPPDMHCVRGQCRARELQRDSIRHGFEGHARFCESDMYAVFTASRGSPPYSWSVSDSSLGQVPDTSEATVTYTRIGSTLGGKEVYVRDNNDWTVATVVSKTDVAETS